jgi:Fe-S cluster biosynthesis and repair protein YggX
MPTAISHAETLPVRSPAELKKPYGTCGHVMLTDTEGRHLREVYGPHLAIAIDILDGYIENDGKAAKKYKNHAAVLRKGNWVWNKVQEMILNEKRIENASKQGDRRSFRQQEREHQTELMHKSLFAPSIGMDNREITNG